MSDLLAAMVGAARRSAEEREKRGDDPQGAIEPVAAADETRAWAFRESLERPGIRIIAECKRRSPSRGVLRAAYDAAAIAKTYEAAGAAAISVLTDPAFFDGSLDHLRAVREAVRLPLLSKDFIVTDRQVIEAHAAGADAVLFIVAALDDSLLRRLMRTAGSMGLASLVEVHDRAELDRALAAGATIVGVNSRNLRTLDVDVALLDQLLPSLPEQVLAIAESGLKSAADLRRLRVAGYRAFLIGERFMTAPDPGVALGELKAAAEAGFSGAT
jgi:indole-3-glycerol phosphate synthase